MQGFSEPQIVAVAFGLSMLVFGQKWRERITLGPRSAVICALAILVLIGISNP